MQTCRILTLVTLIIVLLAMVAFITWRQLRNPRLTANYSLLKHKPIDKSTNKIPRQIYMTTRDKTKIPVKVKDNWVQFGDKLPIAIFDDEECERFIDMYFTDKVLRKFKSLRGAHRADLFRYCILYIKGGLYVDIKTKLTQPIESVFDFDQDGIFYTVLSIVPKTIYQGILATWPGNEIFLIAISSIIATPSALPKLDYHVFTRQFYNICLQKSIDKKLEPGGNLLENGKNLMLYQEKCSDQCTTPDQYGRCCSIYNDQQPIIDVRWSDYPWKF